MVNTFNQNNIKNLNKDFNNFKSPVMNKRKAMRRPNGK